MNQFNWDQAFTLDFDLNNGLSKHADTTKRYLSQMKNLEKNFFLYLIIFSGRTQGFPCENRIKKGLRRRASFGIMEARKRGTVQWQNFTSNTAPWAPAKPPRL